MSENGVKKMKIFDMRVISFDHVTFTIGKSSELSYSQIFNILVFHSAEKYIFTHWSFSGAIYDGWVECNFEIYLNN